MACHLINNDLITGTADVNPEWKPGENTMSTNKSEDSIGLMDFCSVALTLSNFQPDPELEVPLLDNGFEYQGTETTIELQEKENKAIIAIPKKRKPVIIIGKGLDEKHESPTKVSNYVPKLQRFKERSPSPPRRLSLPLPLMRNVDVSKRGRGRGRAIPSSRPVGRPKGIRKSAPNGSIKSFVGAEDSDTDEEDESSSTVKAKESSSGKRRGRKPKKDANKSPPDQVKASNVKVAADDSNSNRKGEKEERKLELTGYEDSDSEEFEESDSEDSDSETYSMVTCPCGKPYAGRAMIECDNCLVWYHMSCERVRVAKVPEVFFCHNCQEQHNFGQFRRSDRKRKATSL